PRPRLAVGPFGVPGDRAFALRDPREGRILSAKRTSALLALAACYPGGARGPALVTLPDGRTVATDTPDATTALAALLARPIEIVRSDDAGADRSFQGEGERTCVSPDFAFVDQAPLHLLTTASLRAIGADAPAARRFRPNVLVDCGRRAAFVEDALAGAEVTVGEAVRLRILKRTPRCVLTTRAVEDLPADPAVLRTVVERNA